MNVLNHFMGLRLYRLNDFLETQTPAMTLKSEGDHISQNLLHFDAENAVAVRSLYCNDIKEVVLQGANNSKWMS